MFYTNILFKIENSNNELYKDTLFITPTEKKNETKNHYFQ
jgi:hypothetical protein